MNSQHSNGWVDDGSSSAGREGGDEGSEDHVTEVEVALAQGIASSLRTLVIASFRAPPNKFVLGETKGDKRRRKGGGGILYHSWVAEVRNGLYITYSTSRTD